MKKPSKGMSLLLTATLAFSGPISAPASALAAETPEIDDEAGAQDEGADEGLVPGEQPAPFQETVTSAPQPEIEAMATQEAPVQEEPAAPSPADEGIAVAAEGDETGEGEAPAEDTSIHVSTFAELKTAATASTVSADAENPTVITLDADVELTTNVSSGGITIATNKYVRINGNGHTVTYNCKSNMTTSTSGMFVVAGNLTFEDITIIPATSTTSADGKVTYGGANRAAYVNAGGTLVLGNGAVIKGAVAKTNLKDGLGVYVTGSASAQGKLYMEEGSKICDFRCDGSVSPNGLAVYVTNGYFQMDGGEICNNATPEASTPNIGVTGTVYVTHSLSTGAAAEYENFVMNGGSIHDNTARIGGAVYFMYYAHGTFNGGTIKNNAARFAGGALVLYYGMAHTSAARCLDVVIEKDMEVSGNSAVNGGAIYAAMGRLTVNGATIKDNTATTDLNAIAAVWTKNAENASGAGFSTFGENDGSIGSGGAIYVASADVFLNNATVTGNKAESTFTPGENFEEDQTVFPAGNGGGIYVTRRNGEVHKIGGVESPYSVNIAGGTIKGNQASANIGDESGNGDDICAALNPYASTAAGYSPFNNIYLTDAASDESGALSVGELAVMNKVSGYASNKLSTMAGAPMVGLKGNVSIDRVALPAPVVDSEGNTVEGTAPKLYLIDALKGNVGFDATALKDNTVVMAGANGYLMTTVDLKALSLSPAISGRHFDFNSAGNAIVTEGTQLDATDLSDASVEFEYVAYTGGEATPKPTVKLGEVTLDPATDYSVAYSNNIEAGDEAVAVINGRGNYTGTIQANFTISPRTFNSENISFSEISEYFATGSSVDPIVSAKDGETDLSLGKDFEISYRNNIDPGEATLIATGVGNYSGSVEIPFKINAIEGNMRAVKSNDELKAALADPQTDAVILGTSFEVTEMQEVAHTVAIEGNSFALTYTGAAADAMFKVRSGGDATMKNINLNSGTLARSIDVEAEGRAVIVNSTLAGKKSCGRSRCSKPGRAGNDRRPDQRCGSCSS